MAAYIRSSDNNIRKCMISKGSWEPRCRETWGSTREWPSGIEQLTTNFCKARAKYIYKAWKNASSSFPALWQIAQWLRRQGKAEKPHSVTHTITRYVNARNKYLGQVWSKFHYHFVEDCAKNVWPSTCRKIRELRDETKKIVVIRRGASRRSPLAHFTTMD